MTVSYFFYIFSLFLSFILFLSFFYLLFLSLPISTFSLFCLSSPPILIKFGCDFINLSNCNWNLRSICANRLFLLRKNLFSTFNSLAPVFFSFLHLENRLERGLVNKREREREGGREVINRGRNREREKARVERRELIFDQNIRSARIVSTRITFLLIFSLSFLPLSLVFLFPLSLVFLFPTSIVFLFPTSLFHVSF